MESPTGLGPTGARANRAKHRLDAGETVVVVAGHSPSADTIDFIGPLGFDGFWLEGEHGPVSWDRIGDLTRACDLWGMSALLRVRTLDPTLIVRGLSLGAHGIVVPQVNTAQEAEQLVEAAKFSPIGSRGVTRGRRSYGRSDFLDSDNDETLLVVQLECPEALENIEEISAVEHLDVVFIAPNDLAQAMGHQGQVDHPSVVSAIDEGITRIVAAGAAAGTLCTGANLERFTSLGARFLYTTYDAWIQQGATKWLQQLNTSLPSSGATQ